jgi:hypothetical protein
MANGKQTERNYLDELYILKYDPNEVIDPETIVFTIQGQVIGTTENYCVFSGLPKVGKSTFLSALIGSFILPDFQDNWGMKLKPPKSRNRLAYFDTESGRHDFVRQVDRIKEFGLRDNLPENVDCFRLRGNSPKTIRKMIEAYLIAKRDCSILIVDGLLDLCLNYNDEIETRLLANWFKKITNDFQILLIGVLHLGKEGANTLGHLGSNTDRWAQSTLKIEKDDTVKQIILKAKYLRSAPGIDPIALMNFNGKWSQVNYEHKPEDNKKGRKQSA